MNWWQRLFNKNKLERQLDSELSFHFEQQVGENIRRGMNVDEARRAARIEFGGIEDLKEECRDARGTRWAENTIQDVRLALRQMRRAPGFAFTAVLILSLGIAANVIVFGVVQALILRPLAVAQPERLMELAHKDQLYPMFAYPEVRDVRDRNKVFAGVAAWGVDNFALEAKGFTRPVWGYFVSGPYFEVLGIRPYLGRLLNRADDEHAASDAVVLSWPEWQADFGADRNIIGKLVRINKHPYTVVGVTPEGFYGTEKFLQPSLFVPRTSAVGVPVHDARSEATVYSLVRIKEGVTQPQVQTDLDAIAAQLKQEYPKEEEKVSFQLVQPGLVGDFLGKPAHAFLAGVMSLAGIVLLAACANIGSLFAARTADRTREIAIRLAIGSSRRRILAQILMEALLIALAGGALACGLAWMALSGLATWHPPTEFPMVIHVLPQTSLILMALIITLLAGALFGLMPLRQIFNSDPNEAIKSGGNPTAAGRRWALRDLLLAAQIALCCLTVTAAFVSLRGLNKTLNADLGFQPQNAVLAKFELSQAGYTAEEGGHLQRRILEQVSHLPGVVAAAYANTTPLPGDTHNSPVFDEKTVDLRPANKAFEAFDYAISPGYLNAAGTRLLAGREFTLADNQRSRPVAIVNEAFARKLFHSENAVGRYFKNLAGVSIQIVGVVAQGKYLTVSEEPQEAVFFPILREGATGTAFIVRLSPHSAETAVGDMAEAVRKTIREIDPSIPIQQCKPWSEQLGFAYIVSQVATVSLGLFGAFGLLLSIAGTFGLASYSVSKRMRELSIRIALGAQAKQVLASALGRLMVVLGVGSLVGLALGVAASQVLSAIVYQASAQDPLVLLAVGCTMLLTGGISVAGPVARTLRLDPASLLREQ